MITPEMVLRIVDNLSEEEKRKLITAYALPKIKYKMRKHKIDFQTAFDMFIQECIWKFEKGEMH